MFMDLMTVRQEDKNKTVFSNKSVVFAQQFPMVEVVARKCRERKYTLE